jgi:hypothetical protein
MSSSASLETTSCSTLSAPCPHCEKDQPTLPLTGVHQFRLGTFIRGVHIPKLVLDSLDLFLQVLLPVISLDLYGFDSPLFVVSHLFVVLGIELILLLTDPLLDQIVHLPCQLYPYST